MTRHAGLLLVVLTCGSAAAWQQAPAIDRAELLGDARTLSADDMQGRLVGTAGNAKARAYIAGRFAAIGLERFGATYERPFTASGGRGGVNLVGRIQGTGASDRAMVVSAHYDHVGIRDGQIFNGADDNASGTAALISIARYFAAHRPQHPLVVAAFDAEEGGLRGSRAFVANPPIARARLAMNVNIDMIGRDPGRKLWVVGTYRYPFLKPYVQRVADSVSAVTLLLGHDDPNDSTVADWTRDSDHWAFMEAGIPALYIGDENYEHHHKPTDDFETLMPDFFVGAADASVRVIQELDRALDQIVRETPARK